MIKDDLIVEVTEVSKKTRYLNGYNKPATEGYEIQAAGGENHDSLRSANFRIPGNLPVGTRFKVTIEQIDEVTPAIIQRGALPEVRDHKLIEAGTAETEKV